MSFCERLKSIRITEKYTQQEFADSIDVALSSVGHYEAGRADPTQKVISALLMKFPEYSLWLMIGQTSGDQIDPYIKQSQSDKTA